MQQIKVGKDGIASFTALRTHNLFTDLINLLFREAGTVDPVIRASHSEEFVAGLVEGRLEVLKYLDRLPENLAMTASEEAELIRQLGDPDFPEHNQNED